MILEETGKSSTRAKNKYRDKTYDRIEFLGPVGSKAKLEAFWKAHGYESRNAFVLAAVQEKMEREAEKK